MYHILCLNRQFQNLSLLNPNTMSIQKDLNDLVKDQVISQETSLQISAWYEMKKQHSGNRLMIAFGILGGILVGLGIILIIANQWDNIHKHTQSFLALVPVLIGVVACGFTILKKRTDTTWVESSTAFLFLAIGACVGLIANIYDMPGDASSFLLTWMLFGFPLIYVMNSSVASIFFIAGITNYAGEVGYWNSNLGDPYLYWLLLAGVLPYYFLLIRNKPDSNFTAVHHWIIPISVAFTLGSVNTTIDMIMFLVYLTLFGAFYLIGHLPHFKDNFLKNGYLVIGALGSVVTLIIMSFDSFWVNLNEENLQLASIVSTPEFLTTIGLIILATLLLYNHIKSNPWNEIKPVAPVFLIVALLFFAGLPIILSTIISNLILLIIGILTIRGGALNNHLGVMNYGLIIITMLVISRFFDADINFVIRGVLFILVGIGFFIANYWMVKLRKSNPS